MPSDAVLKFSVPLRLFWPTSLNDWYSARTEYIGLMFHPKPTPYTGCCESPRAVWPTLLWPSTFDDSSRLVLANRYPTRTYASNWSLNGRMPSTEMIGPPTLNEYLSDT